MPGKSGLDFGDILLKENLKKNTKLILFSSISDMIDANTIFKHGFDSYLYKPVKYHPFRKIVFETINKQVEYKLKDSGVIEGKKEEKTKEKKKNFDIKILLAEDNIINQKVASVTLNKLGFKNVDVANNGTEAVQMHLKNQYDLILMDIQMPVMNGLEATGKIRENERDNNKLKRVKIIALTANALESDVKMYLQHDMDGVITKPFKPADLKRIIG
jgi:CheY-like chemotaxis protein